MELILIIAVLIFVKIQGIATLECYACGVGADEPFKISKFKIDKQIPETCNEFGKLSNLHEYIVMCPPKYVGCNIQIDGDQVTRTCDMFQIDDCKTANGIEYCYCSKELCNKETEHDRKLKQEQQRIQREYDQYNSKKMLTSSKIDLDEYDNGYGDSDDNDDSKDDEDIYEASGMKHASRNNYMDINNSNMNNNNNNNNNSNNNNYDNDNDNVDNDNDNVDNDSNDDIIDKTEEIFISTTTITNTLLTIKPNANANTNNSNKLFKNSDNNLSKILQIILIINIYYLFY